jgi:hypothetical protein
MADNRAGVRAAYRAACEEARRAGRSYPTLSEVQAHAPGLHGSFVQYTLEVEGKMLQAGAPVTRGVSGTRPVYDTPVQLSPGEPPVIRTQTGIRPAYDVAYQDQSGRTVIRTRNGIRVVRK